MNGRNRRGNRRPGMKARIGIATAVLAGGGAVGVAAVAAANHGPATTAAESAGFTLNFHHAISEQQALTSALDTWGWSQQKSLTTLAEMTPMRTFSQFWSHRTEFAAQRGVVELATRKFLLVKSADGQLHLWWLTGATKIKNVSATATGMAAMTGSNTAATSAVKTGNMAPAAVTMAGSTAAVSQLAAPVTKPTTVTVETGNEIITITITTTTATVTEPATTTATTTPTTTPTSAATATAAPTSTTATAAPTSTTTATAAPTATATAAPATTVAATAAPTTTATTQPTFTAASGVARGDLVFVIGVRKGGVHGALFAELVLFAAPSTATAATTPTTTVTAQPTVTTPASSVSGTHS